MLFYALFNISFERYYYSGKLNGFSKVSHVNKKERKEHFQRTKQIYFDLYKKEANTTI